MYIMSRTKIPKPLAFEWDEHNKEKNWVKHQVDYKECEQAFKNKPQAIFEDLIHSRTESRYTLLSFTDNKRYLFISFTIRAQKIRIISARDQDKKERRIYEESKK